MAPEDVAFGRVKQFDDHSRAYSINRHPKVGPSPVPVTKRWTVPPPAPLNQANTPQCVAFAGAHLLIADPVETKNISNTTGHTLYRQCKLLDGLPRGLQGTSVLALAKALKADQWISSYSWAFSELQLAAAVSAITPCVIGVEWQADMMDPDSDGYIHASGGGVGGHAPLIIGVNMEQGYYDVLCAWTDQWADNGVAKLSRTDMALLLADQGEAMVPIQVDRVTPTPAHA